MGAPEIDSARARELRRAADRHVLHSVERGSGDRRLVLERAEGCRVWDVDGREYLDAVSGTNGPALVGHNHPRVREAIVAQLDRIADHFYVYDSPPVVELAGRLAGIAPARLDKTIFCPGGGDGIEAAVKLAMRITGKAEVVSLYGAYHGLGLATAGLGGLPALREWMPGAQRWPSFRQGPAPDTYRRPFGLAADDLALACARALEATITRGGDEPGRGADHRAGSGTGRPRRLPAGVVRGGPGDLPPPRSAADRRRGADRTRPLWRDVRLRPLRARAGHPRARQGARGRAAVRGDDDPRRAAAGGDRGRALDRVHVPEPAAAARPPRSRCSGSSRASGSRSGHGSSASGPPGGSRGCETATPASATSAGRACSSASTWSSIARPASRPPRPAPAPSTTRSRSGC